MTTVLVTLLAVVAVLVALLVVELLREPMRAPSHHGRFGLDLADVDRTHLTLLVFLTTTCTTCAELWKALAGSRRGLARGARLLLVTKGAEVEDRARLRRVAPRGVPLVMSTEAWGRYGVTAAPFVVCIDAAGTVVAAGAVSGWADVVAACPAPAAVS